MKRARACQRHFCATNIYLPYEWYNLSKCNSKGESLIADIQHIDKHLRSTQPLNNSTTTQTICEGEKRDHIYIIYILLHGESERQTNTTGRTRHGDGKAFVMTQLEISSLRMRVLTLNYGTLFLYTVGGGYGLGVVFIIIWGMCCTTWCEGKPVLVKRHLEELMIHFSYTLFRRAFLLFFLYSSSSDIITSQNITFAC